MKQELQRLRKLFITRITRSFRLLAPSLLLIALCSPSCLLGQDFEWPDGKKMAVSLSFDDARKSHPNGGAEFLSHNGIKATFYVVPSAVKTDLAAWKKIVKDGHEIGNHTMFHPCTGNFDWTTGKELENYDLQKMRMELLEANESISAMLGVTPVSFAYTCGESYVGRGSKTVSMVPLIDELFQSGRDWRNEMTNDPSFVDLAQVRATEMDGIDFEDIRETLKTAMKEGSWVALAGHEIDERGPQTVRIDFLIELFSFVKANPEIWLATDGEIAAYIKSTR